MLMVRWLRSWRIIAACLLLALAGCSALRLAYTQAGEFAYWWLDGYVDFDGDQTLRTREAITRWFAWHRRAELPDYVSLLDRAAAEAGQDATPAQACRWFEEVRQRIDRAVDHALPDAAAIAASFSREQLNRLERKQAKNNAEFRDDFLQPDPAERREEAADRVVERAEQLYGQLDRSQRERIAQAMSASPFEPERWLAERQRRQRHLLLTLRQVQAGVLSRPSATEALRNHWQEVKRSPDEAYRRYQQRLETANCELLSKIHNDTTPEQRQEAQRKLRGWAADLRRLATPA
ncbi:DUF6279 family lipoprotein [Methylibium sp. Root1272]|uniref:DUF6279 family lipoprotein n=1 Tax=Methylibium sp. Root1272 TaxID=1736441 RepID=UPI0012E869DC|nr:DUF6279 family lipoprotein [Methylibium sp. Root1272]